MQNNFIESNDNKNLKLVRKLKNKKNRYHENKFVIESRKLLEEAIKNSCNIEFILLREDISVNFNDKLVYTTSIDLFNKVSHMTSPDGYLAVVNFPEDVSIESDLILLLDRVSDPGNLGTIIRSAEAFGFSEIYLLESVDPYNDKTLRASMGSIFRIAIKQANIEDVKILANKYNLYAADMDGIDFRQEKFEGKICLIIGNEANGLSEDVFSLASKTIKIPMQGKLESLNAAISASILMNQISYIKNK